MTKFYSYILLLSALTTASCKISAPQAKDAGGPPPGPGGPTKQTPQLTQATAPRPISKHTISHGSSLYNALKQEGVPSALILRWIELGRDIYPVKDVTPGTQFSVTWSDSSQAEPLRFELAYAADSRLVIEKNMINLEWTASDIKLPVVTRQRTFRGVVDSSLWESAEIVGVDASLITNLSEVFAWQIDFNRAVKHGDRWRLTVEEKLVEDKPIGWGNILVAEYENDGQMFTGIRYPVEGATAAYYAPNGQSLRRMFLKSPIKFGRITSGYSNSRFHPILRENRPHLGVDYGAPAGTPVLAVGRGQIEYLGFNGGSGKMVKIRHNGTYSTAYMHLSSYAQGLAHGAQVEQGQVIGYVGSTGLATGPHLHFSFYENGVYRDPIGIRFPSADPVPTQSMQEFQKLVAQVMRTLPDWQVAEDSRKKAKSETVDQSPPLGPTESGMFH